MNPGRPEQHETRTREACIAGVLLAKEILQQIVACLARPERALIIGQEERARRQSSEVSISCLFLFRFSIVYSSGQIR